MSIMEDPIHRNASKTEASRLRFVFADAVIAFDLAANTTLADVAHRLSELEFRYYAHPQAIVVVRGETRH